MAQRKTRLERLAKEAGIEAVFHFRLNPKGLLPWPPYDVLALLPVSEVMGAALALHLQKDGLRALVDSSVRLTVMPCIDGVAYPSLAKSDYQDFSPDADGAMAWAENLGLPCAPSAIAGLFRKVLSLAGELAAMDRLGLGTEARPEEEIVARRSLASSFDEKRRELAGELDAIDPSIEADVFELADHLRTGYVDFVAEAQATFDGAPTDVTERALFLTLLLIELERQAEKRQNELK